MQIEIITTGHELLDGRVLNTNAHYLAALLAQYSLEPSFITVVGDQPTHLIEVLQTASKRAQIIIMSGGLGPTQDDLTSAILARLTNVELVEHQTITRHLKKRALSCMAQEIKQAYLPHGAQIIINNIGSAPGLEINYQNATIFALPGVPAEMIAMFEKYVLKRILKICHYSSNLKILKTNFKCFGAKEAQIQLLLQPLYPLPKALNISFQVAFPEVHIVLHAKEHTPSTQRLFKKYALQISELLKEYLYSQNSASFSQVVNKFLIDSQLTLSIAESCTGGLIASKLIENSGASAYLITSIVAYSNQAKMQLLNVQEHTLNRFGAVSRQTALEMACGIKNIAHTDYAISCTGLAGPGGGTKQKPVGTVYIAIASPQKTKAYKFHFLGTRQQIQLRAAYTALHLLIKTAKKKQP
jgi:nicotinamide-nucleotide amidase